MHTYVVLLCELYSHWVHRKMYKMSLNFLACPNTNTTKCGTVPMSEVGVNSLLMILTCQNSFDFGSVTGILLPL